MQGTAASSAADEQAGVGWNNCHILLLLDHLPKQSGLTEGEKQTAYEEN